MCLVIEPDILPGGHPEFRMATIRHVHGRSVIFGNKKADPEKDLPILYDAQRYVCWFVTCAMTDAVGC